MKFVRVAAGLFVFAVSLAPLHGAIAASTPRHAVSKVRKTAATTTADTTVTIASILGIWHGHSDCLQKGTACNDEIVEYHFEPSPGHPDSIWLDAKKLVAGRYGSMGKLPCSFDASTRTWNAEFRNPRVHILWSFQIVGKKIVGSLVDLPDRTPKRHAEAVFGMDPKVKERD